MLLIERPYEYKSMGQQLPHLQGIVVIPMICFWKFIQKEKNILGTPVCAAEVN